MVILVLLFWTGAGVSGILTAQSERGRSGITLNDRKEVQRLRGLYSRGLMVETLKESLADENNERFVRIKPEIMFLEWLVNRQQDNAAESTRILREFLSQFPHNALGADMCFADAQNLRYQGNQAAAKQELHRIIQDYPDTIAAHNAHFLYLELSLQ